MDSGVPCRPQREEQLIAIIFNKRDILLQRAVPPRRDVDRDAFRSFRRPPRGPLSRDDRASRATSFLILYGQTHKLQFQRRFRVPSHTPHRTFPPRILMSCLFASDGRVPKRTARYSLPLDHPGIDEGAGQLGLRLTLLPEFCPEAGVVLQALIGEHYISCGIVESQEI